MEARDDLRCPECRAVLKQRRTRTPDACEMLCGGCGRMFDICEDGTLEELKGRPENPETS